MPDRPWKRAERNAARIVGGRRVPVTGRGRGDAPDIEHDWLAIECKQRRVLPAWIRDALAQARASARDGQLPVAILHETGRRYARALVVVELADFQEWFGSIDAR